jgi:hypothetical protein
MDGWMDGPKGTGFYWIDGWMEMMVVYDYIFFSFWIIKIRISREMMDDEIYVCLLLSFVMMYQVIYFFILDNKNSYK